MDLSFLPEGRIRRSIAQVARDLEMLIGPWQGRRPAPFNPRERRSPVVIAAADAAPGASLGAREVRVAARIQETPEAITLALVDPSGAALEFTPGAFFTVIATIAGDEHRRAYSAGVDPEGRLTLTIKRVPGGLVSGHLHERVQVGDPLRLLGPSGAFTLAPSAAGGRRLVMIAGGSGITPIMAMIRASLAPGVDARPAAIALIYGNRRRAAIIFEAALAELAAAHPGTLLVRHVLEDLSEETGFSAQPGRLDEPGLDLAFDGLAAAGWDLAGVDGFYVCGPEPVLGAARAVLGRRGVADDRRHEERFTAPARRSGARTAAAAEVTVTIRRGGRERPLVVPAGRTLLEAAQAAGEPLPFSCAMGGCGACKVRVVAGEVAMDEPNCLSAGERALGHALTCVGAPLGPCTLEVPEATP